jgi:hypothetical protein
MSKGLLWHFGGDQPEDNCDYEVMRVFQQSYWVALVSVGVTVITEPRKSCLIVEAVWQSWGLRFRFAFISFVYLHGFSSTPWWFGDVMRYISGCCSNSTAKRFSYIYSPTGMMFAPVSYVLFSVVDRPRGPWRLVQDPTLPAGGYTARTVCWVDHVGGAVSETEGQAACNSLVEVESRVQATQGDAAIDPSQPSVMTHCYS